MHKNYVAKFKDIIYTTDLIKYLRAMKQADIPKDSWLLAGAVRNTVWKYLFPDCSLEVNDVDIIHYSPNLKSDDSQIFVDRLSKIYPQVKWDCANQFYIYDQKKDKYHMPNGPYSSIEDSMKDFWFTVNTIAIRLNENNEIEIMNEQYLNDLFNGVLRVMEFQKDNYEDWFLKRIEKITSRCLEIEVIR